MRDFHKLKAYKKSFPLALNVMKMIDGLPRDRDVMLQRRICSAALNIPAKLANGCGYGTRRGLLRMAMVASGSAASLDSLLLMAHKRELIDETRYGEVLAELIEVRDCLNDLLDRLVRPQSE